MTDDWWAEQEIFGADVDETGMPVNATDTDALTERMAEEMYYSDHPEGRHRNEWPDSVYSETVYEYRDLAAAVLPIIAEEVRRAKAEALREAALQYGAGQLTGIFSRDDYTRAWLQARATEYETGDQR